LGRFGAVRARQTGGENRSGARSVDVSELFQIWKKGVRLWVWEIPTGPSGEGGETKSVQERPRTPQDRPKSGPTQDPAYARFGVVCNYLGFTDSLR